jgi:hypothetical protein
VLGFALSLYLNAGDGADIMQRHRRAAMQQELEATGERHLILVRYGANHPPVNEWVHNGADIDTAKVVWARGADRGDSCELIRYFKDRRIWQLDADLPDARLIGLSATDTCPLDAKAAD